ncbi:fimbria/pilus outer membrane usher protein [Acinetobacter nectaris]|uniref:fimbria/pilus outer membrane usher protein n=1 Tax=Acinetobacter nectaris TaxID=1219382 RepID=UPI001F023414|nr:fimbria/pilus outer membrane usher protein [Acinetobacter nectaris]MCF9035494.1 fimbrial biogenesis outer membrane usher protein [Acinetobacter nectaris]
MLLYNTKKSFKYFLLLPTLANNSYANSFLDSTNASVPAIPSSVEYPLLSKNNEDSKTLLFLSIFVNHAAYSDLIAVRQDHLGKLYIKAHDLRLLRLLIQQSISDNDLIALDNLKYITFSYHPSEQTLFIKAPSNYLSTYTLNLAANNSNNSFKDTSTIDALILNYNIYTNYFNHHYGITSNQDLTYGTNHGNFNASFLYSNSKNNILRTFTRLDTNWKYINPSKINQYTFGDFNSNTTDWGSSIRLAGFQWASAYAQRPDILTTAMPSISGTAVLPSTLDLYVNQQKIFSGNIPSGNFDIRQIPYISGNEVTLVTTDEIGKQVVKKEPYYYSPQLLNTGIKEFSLDVGIPRYNYGLLSNNYNTHLILSSGAFRYGYNPLLTLSCGGEVSTNGLANLGIGGATRLLGRGLINTSFAFSHYQNSWGELAQVGIDSQLGPKFTFNTSYQMILNKYANLAYASQQRIDHSMISTAFAQKIFRASMNYSFTPQYSLSLGYNQINYNNSLNKILSINFSGNINQNWGGYLSGYTGLNNKNNSAFLTLRYNPSIKLTTTTSASINGDTVGYRQEILTSNTNNGSIGSFSNGGYIENIGSAYNGSIYGSYTGSYNTVSGAYIANDRSQQITASLTGSIIATSRKLFFANQIGNGFAIVNHAGPNSQVLNGGVNLGQTNTKGQFLITNLEPYQKQSIYINPINLPLGWSLASTQQNTMVTYKRGTIIDFGAHEATQGLAKIIDKTGRIIDPGYMVLINGKDSAIVGYSGQVFIENLQYDNILIVDRLSQGKCKVKFLYNKSKQPFNILGPYICK